MVKYKKILIFFLIFIFVFCFSCFFMSVFADEIWNYGFAYNIYRGLVPYRDFNMIVTPLYNFILSIFIFLFGHHLYSIYILDSLLVAVMVIIIYDKIGFNVLFLIPIFVFNLYNGYNFLCLFLTIVILNLIELDFNYKDFIIGFIIGLLILTKQTVGLCVFIPLLILSKNKIKYLIGVLIPIFVFLIYLICNNALYNFIDYCFLGMLNFSNSNKFYAFLPVEIIVIFVMFYLYFKKYVNSSIFIVIMFQIIVFPIFDWIHFMFGFILFLYYLFINFRINNILKCLIFSLGVITIIFLVEDLDFYYINDNKSFLYGKRLEIKYDVIDYIDTKYILNKDKYDYVFFFSDLVYLSKLDTNNTLNKYDLINDGNMGYNGEKKYISEITDICSKKSCYFIIDTQYVDVINKKKKLVSTNQINLNIIKYVNNNYKLVRSEYGFSYYSNDKEY